jgi:hypothetical protein
MLALPAIKDPFFTAFFIDSKLSVINWSNGLKLLPPKEEFNAFLIFAQLIFLPPL